MPPPTTVLLFALPGLLHDILGRLAAADPAVALVDARAGEEPRTHRVDLGELSADAVLAVIAPRGS
jgi:hypothetical protein